MKFNHYVLFKDPW